MRSRSFNPLPTYTITRRQWRYGSGTGGRPQGCAAIAWRRMDDTSLCFRRTCILPLSNIALALQYLILLELNLL